MHLEGGAILPPAWLVLDTHHRVQESDLDPAQNWQEAEESRDQATADPGVESTRRTPPSVPSAPASPALTGFDGLGEHLQPLEGLGGVGGLLGLLFQALLGQLHAGGHA